ncbi:MAG: gliding motility lipoprotein GldH [Bacteroidota bacterium]
MQKNINASYLGLVLFFIILSCSGDILFEKHQKIPEPGWSISDTLVFDVPVNDTLAAYDIFIHLRNTSDYNWRNIFLFTTTTAPTGEQVTDTLEYYLADASGKWLGKGWGHIWSNTLPYRQNIRFPYKGIYTIKIVQGMRTGQLKHIRDVGIIVSEHKSK